MIGIRKALVAAGLGVALAAGFAGAPAAQDLRVGLSAEPSAFDPHFHNLSPNNALVRHVFEALVQMDENQQVKPGLAESWRLVDDTTWEFKLRRGVTFHDGSPFTADDVIFTFQRAPNVPRSPAGFGGFVRGRTPEKVDDHTLRIRTPAPDPLLLQNLVQIVVISSKAAKDATTEDFNSGRAAVGTGPYKFVEFVPGDRVTVVRNDAHWGGTPTWARITFRFIKADPSRVSALLAGDVDVIEVVPTADVERLKKDARLNVVSGLSNRLIYFHMDQFRDETPFIKAKDGSPIKNPLRDARVRRALAIALNRRAIVERIMEGDAVPAGQFLPDQFFGTSKTLQPIAYDVEGARKLLAEAGFPNGFRMTLHGPAGRYTNDSKIIEAAAQMFARIGIETSVETLPPAVFFSRASTGGPNNTPEFSFILVGWSASTGEVSESLRGLTATFNRETGMGSANRGRYSSARHDALLGQALRTTDDAKRGALLAEASEVAIADMAVIPIHFPLNTWASRKGFKVVPRTDEYTLATSVTRE